MDAVELISVKTYLGGNSVQIEKKIERQTLLLYLRGELDMNTSENLRQVIDQEIDRRGIRSVTLDLEGVSFIDSSGLGVILGRYKKLLPLGGKIPMANVPPHVYKIMELSGLPKIIQFHSENSSGQQDGRKGNAR